jgi:16S rRNA G966 N2-methylase RsmD
MDDFPWRVYTQQELQQEYERLKKKVKKKEKGKEVIPFSYIGFKCGNAFFQYERMHTVCNNRPSTVEYWNRKKENVTKFSLRINRDLFSTLNYFNHAPSNFPPVIASRIYKIFNAKNIFDPYAGWGDRCLAAMVNDIDYTGIDCNKNLEKPFEKMINFFKPKSNIKMFFEKSENIILKKSFSNKIKFDFVFTSPPFWNKHSKMQEIYSYSENDYHKFMTSSLIPIMKKLLLEKVWIALYIPENMYTLLSEFIGNCNIQIPFKTGRVRTDVIYCWKMD